MTRRMPVSGERTVCTLGWWTSREMVPGCRLCQLAVLCGATVALPLAGCGGDGAAPAPHASPAAPVAGATTATATAGSSTSSASATPATSNLKTAVYGYSAAFLRGDGVAAYRMCCHSDAGSGSPAPSS